MKTKKVLYPKVMNGGQALPLGDNFYYMQGAKHKDGGIDIGPNPKTGLEVEGGEVMHLTNNNVKVFSSVPFLNGESPAQKILNGDTPNKVFNAQENYKDRKGIKDDGTKKKFGGDIMNQKKFVDGGKTLKANTKRLDDINNSFSNPDDNFQDVSDTPEVTPTANKSDTWFKNTTKVVGDVLGKGASSVSNYYKNNPDALGDTIGVTSNLIGSLIANNANNKMLDKMKYSSAPVARQATKLKTTININPQLDKMRESVANYERDIDTNTSSSRVALARKQRGRIASQLDSNELFANKENTETQLINQDKLNQQRTSEANLSDYNQWEQGKANFNNTIAEKRAENKVGLVNNINAGIQDIITRGEKRKAAKDNMLTIAAAHPDVNPRILKEMGVTSITDEMVANWEKANIKKSNKSNN